MKTKRRRYQQGSIRRVPRMSGYAWEVRFSEKANGKRWQRCLTFSGQDYPTEASVRKAIETTVILQNSGTGRAKVDAVFGTVVNLYRKEHLPTLRHSTRETNGYLLRRLHRTSMVR